MSGGRGEFYILLEAHNSIPKLLAVWDGHVALTANVIAMDALPILACILVASVIEVKSLLCSCIICPPLFP